MRMGRASFQVDLEVQKTQAETCREHLRGKEIWVQVQREGEVWRV